MVFENIACKNADNSYCTCKHHVHVHQSPMPIKPSQLALVSACSTRNGSVSMWLAPMTLQSAQHACRLVIRRALSSSQSQQLPLPTQLQKYLLYHDLFSPVAVQQ